MKAKIVLVHFPFTDLSGSKLRPAIIIHESEHDVIVAFIYSRIPSPLQESDLLITIDHPAFRSTGLKISSVRLGQNLSREIKYLQIAEIFVCRL